MDNIKIGKADDVYDEVSSKVNEFTNYLIDMNTELWKQASNNALDDDEGDYPDVMLMALTLITTRVYNIGVHDERLINMAVSNGITYDSAIN
jgi:hypothetical protein